VAKPKAPEGAPWKPYEYTDEDAGAVRALFRGQAMEHQQLRVIEILKHISGAYDLSYRPGEEGRRDTDFAEGKRFVWLQLLKPTKLVPTTARDKT
jgi:hypothetical protein